MHGLRLILRHNRRQPFYAIINLTGLIIGFTAFLLIALFVHYEYSYDSSFEDHDRIYQVQTTLIHGNGSVDAFDASRNALGPTAVKELPDVEAEATIWHFVEEEAVSRDSSSVLTDGIYFVTDDFFQVFKLDAVSGNPENWLDAPDKAVVSQSLANKLFGDRNPIGETITYNLQHSFTVSGIVEELPQPTHFGDITLFIPLSFYDYEATWDDRSATTYLRLRAGADPGDVEQNLNALLDRYLGERHRAHNVSESCRLVPLRRVHLDSKELDPILTGVTPAFNPSALSRVLLLLGILILLIAGLNYVNLTTARSLTRSRLAAMLALLGGSRGKLAGLFLTESTLFSIAALGLSLPVVALILPSFNQITSLPLEMSTLLTPLFAIGLLTVALLFGMLAGILPALHFASTSPIYLLRKVTGRGGRLPILRAGFVVLQFTIGVILLDLAIVNFMQVRFIQDRDLGYDESRLLVVRMPIAKIILKKNPVNQALRAEFAALPGVESFTTTNGLPNYPWGQAQLHRPGAPDDEWISASQMFCEASYPDQMGFKIVAGRMLDPTRTNDIENGILINETLCRMLYDSVYAGQAIGMWESADSTRPMEVIGVMKDFHLLSLHEPIKPAVVYIGDMLSRFMVMRVRPGMEQQVLAEAEAAWKRVGPLSPMTSYFLDDSIRQQYTRDLAETKLVRAGSILALAIALLGVLALTSHTAERRRRELSIRKVLGAGEAGLAGLLIRNFLLLALLANLLAVPLGLYLINLWLGSYAYHTPLTAFPFLVTLVAMVLLVIPTAGWHAVQAARANPSDVLRSE